MKTSTLFISTLVAAAMSVPAFADVPEYSGTIYTWSGRTTSGTDLAFGYYYTTTLDENGDASYSAVTSGQSGAWSAVAAIFSDKTNAANNTLRFTALSNLTDDTYSAGTNQTPIYTFAPLSLGGIIVEEGATGFSVASSNASGQRHIYLGNANGTTAYTTINEDFSLSNTTAAGGTTFTLRGTQEWTVASGKTFTINAYAASGVTVAAGTSISVSGGGTVAINKLVENGNATFNVASGTTLNITNLALTGAGTVTFDGGLTAANATFTGRDAPSVATGEGTVSISNYVVGSGFTGTVELKNYSGNALDLNSAQLGVAGSTLRLDNVTNTYLSSATFAANIDVGSGGWTINNGSSGGSNTAGIFSGKITGTGTIQFNKFGTNNAASQYGGYKFTGDLTGFEGGFTYNQANELSFGAATAAEYASTATAENGVVSNIAGTGAITVSTTAALTFNYAESENYDVLALGNASITAASSTVTFGGGADYLVNSSLSASAVAISAGTTTLAGTTNSVSGSISVSGDAAALGLAVGGVSAGSVVFAEGSKLVLSDALLAGTAMTFASDEATDITLSLITSNSISFGGTALDSSNVSTLISDYVEFGSAFDAFGSKTFSYTDGTLSLTLSTIPEPSAFGLLAGLGALALVASRRRRRAR